MFLYQGTVRSSESVRTMHNSDTIYAATMKTDSGSVVIDGRTGGNMTVFMNTAMIVNSY